MPSLDTPSLTASAFQRKWRTPTEFPQCPETATGDALNLYLERLTQGAVFTRNRYGENTVVEAAIGPDKTLSVVCNMPPNSVKHFTHAKVSVEGKAFCHKSDGTFFSQEGAMKAHCMTIGAPYDAYEDRSTTTAEIVRCLLLITSANVGNHGRERIRVTSLAIGLAVLRTLVRRFS